MAIRYTEAFVAIGSENFDAAVAFYTAILGREPDERTRNVHVAYHLPGCHLAIFKPGASNADNFRNSPARHGGLSLVLLVPNVEQAAAELTELGAPAPGPVMDTSHGRELYGSDLDGNRIILVEPTR